LGQLALAVLLLPVTYLPNLVVEENWASYRTLVALDTLVLVYLALALWGYWQAFRWPAAARSLTALVSVAAIMSTGLAAHNVRTYFTIPQERELTFLRAHLIPVNLARSARLYLIGCTWQNSLAPKVRYDEFGLPSSAAPWAPRPMAYLVLQELAPEYRSLPIDVVPASAASEAPPPRALVIDMRGSGANIFDHPTYGLE